MQVKQRLIIPILLMMVGLALYAIHQLMWSDGAYAWHGALFASAALPVYMAIFLAKGGAARTSSHLTPVQIVTIIGVMLAVSDPWALSVALLGFFCLQWYVFVYSKYGRRKSSAIVVGEKLADLVFQTLDGACTSTRDFLGSKTLLVFFRGNWCPLCMAQLREVRARADRLAAAGVETKFISNQSLERSRQLAEKLDLPDHFQILHDHNLQAARALGIEDLGGTPPGQKDYPADTVMATVIALDADGRALFSDETNNYRVRPHPDAFIPVLEASGKRPARQDLQLN